MEKERSYIAIDLKSFYASVECTIRGLDPLGVNLVVADASRTEKTICLAVSPSLKAYGIPGRARLFEVVERIKEVNAERRAASPGRRLNGTSYVDRELKNNPSLAVDYIVAQPSMRRYMEASSKIYQIYLKYISSEDIHVYSVDEVFIDATDYLKTYGMTAHELAMKMIRDVLKETGITATAGIGTNLYLCKIAMDIVAKHMPADSDGVRIAELNEMSYRKLLWEHTPITDFWRVGGGISKKLAKYGMYTMGDIAKCSVGRDTDFYNEDLLYKLFGVNAELLIDHAWGWEPCMIKDIKSCKPENRSLSQGQVLSEPYTFDKARIVIREMTENLVLDLVDKRLLTDQIVITVGYDIANLENAGYGGNTPGGAGNTNVEMGYGENTPGGAGYKGEIEIDRYGRRVPKSAHGSINLGRYTSSTMLIGDKMYELFDRIVNKNLLVRRMYVVANHVVFETDAPGGTDFATENPNSVPGSIYLVTGNSNPSSGRAAGDGEYFHGRGGRANRSATEQVPGQMSLFVDYEEEAKKEAEKSKALLREHNLQQAVIDLKKKYGKNTIIKGTNLQEGATGMERNRQVGGHKA